MSSSIRECIVPLAQAELTAALGWLELEYHPGMDIQEGSYTYKSDTLSIHIESPKMVQIIDFNVQTKSPFDVTVSDGKTQIRSTFDRAATDKFAKLYDRKFTERTLGGVIAITNFYLIFNPQSKPSKRLTLRVSEFDLRGSEGSATFGEPVDVEQRTLIQRLLAEISSVVSGARSKIPGQSPIRSQAGSMSDREPYSPLSGLTQATFSTQVSREIEIHSEGPSRTELRHRSTGRGAEIFDLVAREPRKTGQSKVQLRLQTDEKRTKTNSKAETQPQPSVALQLITDDNVLEISSRLDAKANAQQRQSSLATQQSYSITSTEGRIVQVKETEKFVTPSRCPSSNDSEKENNQESLTGSKWAVQKPRKQLVKTIVERDQQPLPTFIIEDSPDRDSFKGCARMPRRHVRVPKDQQDLLAHKDSWFPPHTGNGSTYLSVATELMKALDMFVDRKIASSIFSGSPQHRVDRESGGPALAALDERQRDDAHYEGDNWEIEENEHEEEKSENDTRSASKSEHGNRHRLDEDITRDGIQNRASLNHESSTPMPFSEEFHSSSHRGKSMDVLVGNKRVVDESELSDDDNISWPESPTNPTDSKGLKESRLKTSDASTRPITDDRNVSSPLNDGHISPDVDLMDLDELPQLPEQLPEQLDDTLVTEGASHLVLKNGIECTHFSNEGRASPRGRSFPRTTVSPLSSPDQVELELALPHAINDYIDETDSETGEAWLLGNLPSTALQSQPVVQVEQTPFPSIRGGRSVGRGPSSKRITNIMERVSCRDVSSDPVIPGTFNDSSPNETKGPAFIAEIVQTEPQTCVFPPAREPLRSEQCNHHGTHLSNNHGEDDGEDRLAHEQLNDGFASSQRQRERDKNVCKVVRPLDKLSSSPGTTVDTSPPHSPNLLLKVEHDHEQDEFIAENLPAVVNASKRDNGGIADEAFRTSLKRRCLETFGLSQEELDVKDTSEIVRAKRHEFIRRLSSDLVEVPQLRMKLSHPTEVKEIAAMELTSSPVGLQGSKTTVKSPVLIETAIGESTAITQETVIFNTAQSPGNTELARLTPFVAGDGSLVEATVEQQNGITWPPTLMTAKAVGGVSFHNSTVEVPGTSGSLSYVSIFDLFKQVYPCYSGSQNMFLRVCAYIEWLMEAGKMLQRNTWDDFIRVYSSEYIDYVKSRKQNNSAKVMTGYEYFNTEVRDFEYTKRVVLPENLHEALSIDLQFVGELRNRFRQSGEPRLKPHSLLQSERQKSESQQSRRFEDMLKVGSSTGGPTITDLQRTSITSHTDAPSKKPFFLTNSQIITTALKEYQIINSASTPKTQHLPWSENTIARTSNATVETKSPSFGCKAPGSPSTTLNRQDSNAVKSSEEAGYRYAETLLRRPQGSPILGRKILERHASEALVTTDIRLDATESPSHGKTQSSFENSKLSASKTSADRTGSRSNASPAELRRVEGWLINQQGQSPLAKTVLVPSAAPVIRKRQSFQDFILMKSYVTRRKRHSGGYSSKASTSNLTTVTRHDVQKVISTKGTEPETQAWEF